MIATIEQRDLDIRHRETREYTALQGFGYTLLDGFDVFLGDGAAVNLVHELEAGTGWQRLNP